MEGVKDSRRAIAACGGSDGGSTNPPAPGAGDLSISADDNFTFLAAWANGSGSAVNCMPPTPCFAYVASFGNGTVSIYALTPPPAHSSKPSSSNPSGNFL